MWIHGRVKHQIAPSDGVDFAHASIRLSVELGTQFTKLRAVSGSDPRQLRVVHVASGDLWAGAEAQIAQLCRALASRDDINVAAILLNDGDLADRLRTLRIETHVLDEQHLTPLRIYHGMVSFLRRWQPDVVHTHRLKENILGSLAARSTRVRACLRTEHGAPEHRPRSWQIHKRALHRLDRWTAENLQQCVVAVSDELKESLQQAYPKSNIAVIPNGIDAKAIRDAAYPPVKLAPGCIHVAFIGRLVPVKRIDVFLRAAAELLQTGNADYRFHVIGDGPLRQELEGMRRDLQLMEVCTFHGFQHDTPRWLASMQCMVLTSDHEGLPMTALEALALGIPVVAHGVGGLVPLLRDHHDCRLVDRQDPAAFAQAIRMVAMQSLPRESTPHLQDRYECDTTARSYAQLYRSLAMRSSH